MSENSNFIHDIIDADLREGRESHVHTRFPPEPNGYSHIGHAKGILINYLTARKYGGPFNLRFDDTNPTKEDEEYVQAITEDITWLIGEAPDNIFYGSDYFPQCYDYAEQLILEGKAFVCDLSPEEMREYRGTLTQPGQESPFKSRSVEENLDLFRRMRAGEFPDGTRTLRAKIDMASPNITLRDPVIYRILHTPHHRQGDAWCIYPMYDFAHPIQDAVEGITHSLCSNEFVNNRPLYDWVLDNLGISPRPHQYEFARLNITNTVMSKRYLRKLVEGGITDGWDDPRMPTLRGLRRRGYTAAAIRDFIGRVGVSTVYNMVDIRLLEHCLREELNKTALRRIAVTRPLKLTIENYPQDKTEYFSLPNNPEDPQAGRREVPFTRTLWIEEEDFAEVPPPKFQRLRIGGEVRLMGAYIVRCERIVKDEDGRVVELICTADLETRDAMPADGRKVRGTVHWVSAAHALDAKVDLFDKLFTLENMSAMEEDKSYDDYLNPESVVHLENCKLEPSLKDAVPGEQFQFVRLGYFCRDSKNPEVFNCAVSLKDSYAKTLK